ncbi:MAG: hypothetical protein ABFD97_04820 [Syntrophobacter sp.]
MLAIPVFRSRVAPVLNWCTRVFIVSEDEGGGMSGREIILDDMNGFDRLRTLREKGIDILICGALSPDLLNYGRALGLRIIPGVAGFLDEVLAAYREKKLDQPGFRLPGCMRGRRIRPGEKCCGKSSGGPVDEAKQVELKSGRGARGSPAKGCPFQNQRARSMGVCVCPRCGAEIPD